MAYPPLPHREQDASRRRRLILDYPFAHIFTDRAGQSCVTRLPFAADFHGDELIRLRAHLNRNNPQANHIKDGAALIAFSGPDNYVSPNWRVDKGRGATWDYTAVHVWGRSKIRTDREFFYKLINDLAANVEPRFRKNETGREWRIEDAPADYVERLLPQLVAFEIEVANVEGIAKLHQDFPQDDAHAVADFLSGESSQSARTISAMIRERTNER